MTGWSLCPGFTHAVETCKVKGLYTAVPDATKSYRSYTLIIVNFFVFSLFGKIKKLGAASTNTDENKKPTKVTCRIMNLVHLCTDAHSLHQFILSAAAAATTTPHQQEEEMEESKRGRSFLFLRKHEDPSATLGKRACFFSNERNKKDQCIVGRRIMSLPREKKKKGKRRKEPLWSVKRHLPLSSYSYQVHLMAIQQHFNFKCIHFLKLLIDNK